MAQNWYVLHVLSGHENKIRNIIETEVPLSNLSEQIGRIVVPTEETVEMKDGKKKAIGHPLDIIELEKYLIDRASILLTDDHAPTDILLAPIFK